MTNLIRVELLSLSGVTKKYPGVTALDNVDLRIDAGEVHGLVGENGAGKSTLIKVLSGVERPQAGTIAFRGDEVRLASPRDAQALGISVLHQERNLIPTFTVGENVLLDQVVRRGAAWFDRKSVYRRAQPFLDMIGLDLDPADPVEGLSSAQKQLIEIARALSLNAALLILDEPTASIAIHEADALLAIIGSLREQGVSVLYVSHKLEEIGAICDRVTVLRDGRVVGGGLETGSLARSDLVARMIGREHVTAEIAVRENTKSAAILEVTGLHGVGSPNPATFTLSRGEILGWYGLVGSGRTELARILIGAEKTRGGEVRVAGEPAQIKSIADALGHYRMGYVTEDRQGEGLFLMHTIARNVSAATWKSVRTRLGWLDPRRENRRAADYRKLLAIKTPSVGQLVSSLSGGNKQKVSLAKWLIAAPQILIIDEPTVGIDIATKYEIHDLVIGLADAGVAVVLISSDLPEMIRLADRILVFRDGAIVSVAANSKIYETMSTKIMSDIFKSEETNL